MSGKTESVEKSDENIHRQAATIDQVLQKFGLFQIRSILLISTSHFAMGMAVISSVFINVTPDYECRNVTHDQFSEISDNETISHHERNFNDFDDQCSRFLISNASAFQTEIMSSAGLRESCLDGWNYDFTNGNTIVSEYDLICESAWKRPLTVSMVLAGGMIGSMFGGQISDRYGRRLSSITFLTANVLVLVALSFSPNYWFYLCFLFANGLTSLQTYLFAFTWAQELVHSSTTRTVAALILNTAYSLGGMALSLVAYLAQDWNWIYRVMAIFHAVCIPLLWFVPESPSWLLESKKTERAIKVAKKIAKTNRIEFDVKLKNLTFENSVLSQETNKGENLEKLSTWQLWRNKTLRRRLIFICLLWNIAISTYLTMALNSSNLGGNNYLNNLIGCSLDVVAAVAITGTLKKFRRRSTLAFLFFVLSIFCALSPVIKSVQEKAGTVSALIGRFFATGTMMLTILYTGEFFPTLLRNTSVCIASMSSRLGSLLAPFLIFAGKEINLSIPFYVMSGITLIGVYLTMRLPDTSKSPLPNSLKEALELKDPRWLPTGCKLGVKNSAYSLREPTMQNSSETNVIRNEYAISSD